VSFYAVNFHPTPARFARRPSPSRAGLSHVAEEVEKECIVPTGAFDLLAHGDARRVGANDVDGEAAQDSEVFRAVVLSCTAAILFEHHVEHPMQAILDTPMTAYSLQDPLGRHVLGEQVVANGRLVGALAMETSARSDARQRDHAGEAVCGSDVGVANDGRAASFLAVVDRRFDTLGNAAFAGAGKPPLDRVEQLALVLFERQRIVATRSSTIVAKGRLQCSASAVTMQPSSDNICSISKAP